MGAGWAVCAAWYKPLSAIAEVLTKLLHLHKNQVKQKFHTCKNEVYPMPGKTDVSVQKNQEDRPPKDPWGGCRQQNHPHRKLALGQAGARSQGQRLQESLGVHQSDGSRGSGGDSRRAEQPSGGVVGSQIEQTRSLIASQEKAIALQLAALEEMQQHLAELERLAAEAESVEEE